MSLTPNGSPVEAAGTEHIDGLYSYALVLTRNRSEQICFKRPFAYQRWIPVLTPVQRRGCIFRLKSRKGKHHVFDLP